MVWITILLLQSSEYTTEMSRSEVSEGYNSLVVPPGPSPTKDNRKLGISIVVPTYREAGTISAFLERVEAAAPSWGAPMELLVMDDDSGDGIESVIEQCQKSWVRLAIRRTDRGLSQAVLAGFDLAQYDILDMHFVFLYLVPRW